MGESLTTEDYEKVKKVLRLAQETSLLFCANLEGTERIVASGWEAQRLLQDNIEQLRELIEHAAPPATQS